MGSGLAFHVSVEVCDAQAWSVEKKLVNKNKSLPIYETKAEGPDCFLVLYHMLELQHDLCHGQGSAGSNQPGTRPPQSTTPSE